MKENVVERKIMLAVDIPDDIYTILKASM